MLSLLRMDNYGGATVNIILMNQRHKENVILSEPTISNSGFRFNRGGQEDSFNCPPTWEVLIKQHHQMYIKFYSTVLLFLLPSKLVHRDAVGNQ